ncbi:hypothetical protein [Nocardiopsis codii]|uniref:hypothetical protein n=1 Tax=Nocardiopsis codii TaxID=3065942 RepID=UPI002E7B31E7|nr:hypothetical protein [Nocardiopsis sp. CT-R113]
MSGQGGPKAFWEREQGSTLGSVRPSAAVGARIPVPGTPTTGPSPRDHRRTGPTGPPARLGGAVAALVVALLSLVVPALGLYLGMWFFLLVANVPGIGFGIMAVVRNPDAAEVERFLRYSWACNFAYAVLSVVFLIPIMVLAVIILSV